jgi:hypothetical protein
MRHARHLKRVLLGFSRGNGYTNEAIQYQSEGVIIPLSRKERKLVESGESVGRENAVRYLKEESDTEGADWGFETDNLDPIGETEGLV